MRPGGTISGYTVAVTGILAALIAAVAAVVLGGIGGETVGLWVADIGSIVVTTVAAVVVLRTALSYHPGEPYRRYWLLAGIGVALYTLGDIIWAVYELSGRDVPYPGAPDIFYFAEYAFLGTALISAALAYRMLVDLRVPAAISSGVSLLLGVALWFGYLLPSVAADAEISLSEKLVSIGYPLADVFIALAPALLLVLVIRSLGGGKLAWPWYPVVLGAVLLAASDTGYALSEATGSYVTGSIAEYGWMAAHALIAVGALLARDVTRASSR